MKLRKILLIAIVSIAISIIPSAVFAHTYGNFEYEINEETNEITIMNYNYDENVTKIEIPKSIEGYPVTAIWDEAFDSCVSVQEIVIPDSITWIGDYVFEGCTGLTTIIIPESVIEMGYGIFKECTNLEEVTLYIPSTYEYDISYSFSEYEGNLKAIISYDIKAFEERIFSYYRKPIDISLPEGIETIGKYVFDECEGLTEINIPSSVRTIENGAFSGCTNLTDINIPEGVTNIGDSAFSGCKSIKEVEIRKDIQYGESVFYNSGVKNIIFENGITELPNRIFSNCENIDKITFPSTITNLGEYTFEGCTNLKEITIPKTVVLSESSFYNSGLQKITFEDGMIEIPTRICNGCKNLIEVIMPNTIRTIFESAFRGCQNLESIDLSDKLIQIGYAVFEGCSKLKNIELPSKITTIGSYAFAYCSSIENIEIPKGVSFLSSSLFLECTNLKYIKLHDGLNNFGNMVFKNCTSLSKIEIPSNIEFIHSECFYGCTSLENIEIPDCTMYLGSSLFEECTNLKTVKIKGYIFSMGSQIFYNCNKLEEVVFSKQINEIEEKSFYNCTSLKSIEIPRNTTTIGNLAFYNCTNLESVKFYNNIEQIVDSAFDACNKLRFNVIKNSVAEKYAQENDIEYTSRLENISECDVEINLYSEYWYTGEKIEPKSIWIKDGDKELEENTHYTVTYQNNINAGTATIVITGKGSYTGTIKRTFNIVGKDIWGVTILGIANKTYTGQAVTQQATIKSGDTILKPRIDYTISYKNNINAGIATVVITGKGNYTGTITKTFVINQILFTSSNVTGIKDKTYTGKNLTQSITVRYGTKTLVENKDYKVTYSNQKNPGKATIKITGIGNYTGTITKTFIIKPKKITGVTNKTQSTTSVTVKWNKETGVSGYELYKYDSSKKKYVKVKTTSGTSYKVTNLKAGTTYKFKVRAYKTVSGKKYYGSYSSVKSLSTKTKTPSISKLTTKNKKATIKWKKVSGATGYEIYMATSKNGKYSKIKTVTKGSTVSYTKTKLKKNKKYYFKIRTYRTVDGKKVYSSYSSVKSIKVK